MPGTMVTTMNTRMMDTPMTAMIRMVTAKQTLIPIVELSRRVRMVFKKEDLMATQKLILLEM